MYTVHMKTILTATEARRGFFDILDRALRGETVLIERKGVPVQLVPRRRKKRQKLLDYRSYFRSSVDQAEQWGWRWDPDNGLELLDSKKTS